METIETLPQNVVDQKTIILKSFLDSTKVRLLGEEKKTNFFTRFGFLKPRSTDIMLIGLSKYYEPFIVIGGKYSIDYCKKHLFRFKTDSDSKRIFIGGEERRLEPIDPTKPSKMFQLVGEERCHYENETFLVIDKFKREFPPGKLHLAPFETKMENLDDIDLRKINISSEEEIELIKSKIVKRPSNADFIIREIFEINDRMLVYTPIYELVFQEVKTSQMITLLVDGVTSKCTIVKLVSTVPEKPKIPEKPLSQQEKNVSKPFQGSSETTSAEDSVNQNKDTKNTQQSNPAEDGKTFTDVKAEATPFEAEIALFLATDLLKRLGFKNKITPVKVVPEGESYIVELSLQDRIAKVIVNTKTKEVKEYDIQESNPV